MKKIMVATLLSFLGASLSSCSGGLEGVFGLKGFSLPIIVDQATAMQKFKETRLSRRKFYCSVEVSPWQAGELTEWQKSECAKQERNFDDKYANCFIDAGGMIEPRFMRSTFYNFRYVDEDKFDLCLEKTLVGGTDMQTYFNNGKRVPSEYLIDDLGFSTKTNQ